MQPALPLLALLLASPLLAASAPAAAVDSFLVGPAGWSAAGEIGHYGPANLYEYIDGAADNFLAYDFQELATRVYEDARKRQLTVEVYRHASALDAFGVYSSERPLHGDYLALGSEGYYEEGVLNFVAGACYVKLSAFDLGDADRAVLAGVAGEIATRIGAPAGLPAELGLLPAAGRVAHSERYIRENFLGQPFLARALSADYGDGSASWRIFVLPHADEAAVAASLQRWSALDKALAGKPLAGDELLLRDPYNGPLRLVRRGRFLAGASGVSDAAWPACRAEILKTLPAAG